MLPSDVRHDGCLLVCRHEADTSICLEFMRNAASGISIPGILRYTIFYESIRSKVYSVAVAQNVSNQSGQNALESAPTNPAISGNNEHLPIDGAIPHQPGINHYRGDISGLFDYDVLAEDDILFAWYEAIMKDN